MYRVSGHHGFSRRTRIFVKDFTISSHTADWNWTSQLTSAGWDGKAVVISTITINSGIYVYGSSTSAYAFQTGGAFPTGSVMNVVNGGYILGAGGAGGGAGGGGGGGGHAVYATGYFTMTNNSYVSGGGGGGGGGGGFYAFSSGAGAWCYAGGGGGGGGAGYAGGAGGGYGGNSGTAGCTNSTAGNGAAGGTGGGGGGGTYGYLYNGYYAYDECGKGCSMCSFQYCNSGYVYGGTGGAGGAWGAAGASGGNGYYVTNGTCGDWTSPAYWYYGQAGGAAGYYAIGNSYITWAVTGTRLGNVS